MTFLINPYMRKNRVKKKYTQWNWFTIKSILKPMAMILCMNLCIYYLIYIMTYIETDDEFLDDFIHHRIEDRFDFRTATDSPEFNTQSTNTDNINLVDEKN